MKLVYLLSRYEKLCSLSLLQGEVLYFAVYAHGRTHHKITQATVIVKHHYFSKHRFTLYRST